MAPKIKHLRSTTSSSPTLAYGELALSFTGGRNKLFAGNSSNAAVELTTIGNIGGMAANVGAFLAESSSANLLSALTTKTGTGTNVFNTSPTFNGATFDTGGISILGIDNTTTGTAVQLDLTGTNYSLINLNGSGYLSIKGIISAATFLVLYNQTSGSVTLLNEQITTGGALPITTGYGTDITVPFMGNVVLQMDVYQERFLLIGGSYNVPLADALRSARTINGISFDGSANIQVPSLITTEVTTTSQTIVVNNSYIANNASQVVFTLPLVSSVGAEFEVVYKGAGGWKINQNANQQMRIGTQTTTSGTGGSFASTAAGDTVKFKCVTANTLWVATSVIGGNIQEV